MRTLELNIYFIRPVGLPGPIKIGCSRWPADRLQACMHQSPLPLEIVGSIPGDFKLERKFHNFLSGSLSHCEWFHPTELVISTMERVLAGETVGDVIDLKSPLRVLQARQKRPAQTAQPEAVAS